jgi:hypothetical protein
LNGIQGNLLILKRFGKAAQRLAASRRNRLCGHAGFGNVSVKIAAQCRTARPDGTSEHDHGSTPTSKGDFHV